MQVVEAGRHSKSLRGEIYAKDERIMPSVRRRREGRGSGSGIKDETIE